MHMRTQNSTLKTQNSLRIVLDARLNAYRIGGIPQYTLQLAQALANIAPADRLILLQHRRQASPIVKAANVTSRTVFTPPHHHLEQLVLPLELLPLRADLAHFPDFIVPSFCPCPSVATFHDLAFLRFPEILDDAARAYYAQVHRSVRRAAALIAVSYATRDDMTELLGIAPERIHVIHEAAAPFFGRLDLSSEPERIVNTQQLRAGQFLLFVSTIEPRKNLPMLLDALKLMWARQPGHNYQLVIAGAQGWRDDAIQASLNDPALRGSIMLLGKVSDDDLRWLYNACRIYVNPSLYEGFGLPLLEAMACSAACVAAHTSSLPEIGADAVCYADPKRPEQWAELLTRLWDDDQRRSELGQRAIQRAGHFSWERAAHETLEVYRSVVH